MDSIEFENIPHPISLKKIQANACKLNSKGRPKALHMLINNFPTCYAIILGIDASYINIFFILFKTGNLRNEGNDDEEERKEKGAKNEQQYKQ